MCNERKGDSGRFYAMLFRTKNINRWGLMYNTRHETLADHSYECAVLAHALAVIGNVYFGKNYNADRIASQALLHDMSEILTGDLPTPVKYYSEEITKAYKRIETEAVKTMILSLDEPMREYYASLTSPDDEEKKIIKAADKLTAYIKCRVELSRGNPEFATASEIILKAIDTMECNELKYFMENYFSSFLSSLDENVMSARG
ncbi:MAG: 5'-deoxynucleotidase [Ruminococcaceae bacterium]|nr:5'-deoxynucleotidase [Oscillospiraceae bacterium]